MSGDSSSARKRGEPRRRQEILDAAAHVFFKKGYESASTRDIADEVGILKGSLYYYVESKEDFLFEIIKANHLTALAALEGVRSTDGDALTKLAAIVRTHVDHFTVNYEKSVVYFRDFRSLSAERQAIINSEGDAYLDLVRDVIRQGQRDRVVDVRIDPRSTSLGIVGTLNSMVHWYRPTGRDSPAKIAAEFAAVIVTGVASEEALAERGGLDAFRGELLATGARRRGKPSRAAG
ncbi:MAG: TetR/AcrR family transcriptional regulator [Microthrixaceae bacterium]